MDGLAQSVTDDPDAALRLVFIPAVIEKPVLACLRRIQNMSMFAGNGAIGFMLSRKREVITPGRTG